MADDLEPGFFAPLLDDPILACADAEEEATSEAEGDEEAEGEQSRKSALDRNGASNLHTLTLVAEEQFNSHRYGETDSAGSSPMSEPSNTQVKRQSCKSNIMIENMPNLQRKLHYFNMKTSDIRLNREGKVKHVNHKDGKFDARFNERLGTRRDGATLNIYIKTYNDAEDATVAVALLRRALNNQYGTMTYLEYLQTINEECLKKEKLELKQTIQQNVQEMNASLALTP